MPKNNVSKIVNKEQDRRITSLEEQFIQVCAKYNEEIGDIQIKLTELSTNQKFLLWFMFAILGGIIGLFFK